MTKPSSLVVLGAGPKAAAIAVHAHVFRALGQSVPDVVVVEPNAVGAHWRGGFGYSDGRQELCTPADHDFGFPWKFVKDPREIELLRAFSWNAFLQESKSGRHANWVYRRRAYATHSEFAEYIDWALKKSNARIVSGRVSSIQRERSQWRVRISGSTRRSSELAVGVVVTGPGEPKRLAVSGRDVRARLFDSADYWRRRGEVENYRAEAQPIVVIGGGGGAAAIVADLLERDLRGHAPIQLIARQLTLYSRGESFLENAVAADVDNWASAPVEVRREYLDRVVRSVVSPKVMARLAEPGSVETLVARVTALRTSRDMHRGRERRYIRVVTDSIELDAKIVIDARGFDPWSFATLVKGVSLPRGDKARRAAEAKITYDLQFASASLRGLFVPSLASMAQGPGLANLNMLGEMARRVMISFLN